MTDNKSKYKATTPTKKLTLKVLIMWHTKRDRGRRRRPGAPKAPKPSAGARNSEPARSAGSDS